VDYERFLHDGTVPRWADPDVLRPPFQMETIAPPYHPKVLEEQDRRSLYGVPRGESVVDPRFGPVESEEAFLLRRFGARGPPAGEVTRSSVALLCAHRLDKWAAVLANPPSRGSPPATPALDAWSKLMPPDQDLVDRPQARPLGDARPPSVPCVAPATFGPFSQQFWSLWPELPPDLPTVLPVRPTSVDHQAPSFFTPTTRNPDWPATSDDPQRGQQRFHRYRAPLHQRVRGRVRARTGGGWRSAWPGWNFVSES
jgi:hypothetical protein